MLHRPKVFGDAFPRSRRLARGAVSAFSEADRCSRSVLPISALGLELDRGNRRGWGCIGGAVIVTFGEARNVAWSGRSLAIVGSDQPFRPTPTPKFRSVSSANRAGATTA